MGFKWKSHKIKCCHEHKTHRERGRKTAKNSHVTHNLHSELNWIVLALQINCIYSDTKESIHITHLAVKILIDGITDFFTICIHESSVQIWAGFNWLMVWFFFSFSKGKCNRKTLNGNETKTVHSSNDIQVIDRMRTHTTDTIHSNATNWN